MCWRNLVGSLQSDALWRFHSGGFTTGDLSTSRARIYQVEASLR
jgi:hypothetical protein